ncbi:MAG TPA: hypothetical protein HA252_06225 [Candidatus Diapherotrites archaeon]|uniref:Uncharacterized protein n=1 Tax=Candidatus Iainarchaeum sp. TaxID=3101447 RepID=A0A7J4JI27_9ARCH|nr:hypothetical protein [Candidatus Diapherotrites archaeon]HIH16974.1 hypothetical protein [Candidatus Diapherotrites archaeon]
MKLALLLVVGFLLLALAGQALARSSFEEKQVVNAETWKYVKDRMQAMPKCALWSSLIEETVASGKVPNLREYHATRNYTFEKCFPDVAMNLGIVSGMEEKAKPISEKKSAAVERDKKTLERVNVPKRVPAGQYAEGLTEAELVAAREAIAHDNIRGEKCKRISFGDLDRLARGNLDVLIPGPRSLRPLFLYCYKGVVDKVLAAMGGNVEVMAGTTSSTIPEIVKKISVEAPTMAPTATGVCAKYTRRQIADACKFKRGDKRILVNCC